MMYELMGHSLDDAADLGLVPRFDEETDGSVWDSRQILVVRHRLFLLGYLERDNQKDRLDERLEAALNGFRRDIGLGAGDDIPVSVWNALQELVSFEHPTNLEHWCQPRYEPILKRAVQLRLFAFGLMARPPRERDLFEGIGQGLADFVRVADLLGISAAPLTPEFGQATLSPLFDLESITDRLSEMGDTVRIRFPLQASQRERGDGKRLVESFVSGLARVELWLLGYHTGPGNPNAFGFSESRLTLRAALPEFWDDQDSAVRPPRSLRNRICGLFFKQLLRLRQNDFQARDDEAKEAALDALLADRDAQKMVRDEAKSLGSRLFDGMKRVGRWFKSVFKRAIGWVKTTVTNLTRILVQKARKGANLIRKVARAFVQSAKFLTQKAFQGSDPGQAVFFHRFDWDFDVLVHDGADPEKLRALSGKLTLRARLFSAASRIMGLLLGIFVGLFKQVIAGWIGILIALSRLGKSVRKLAAAFQRLNVLVDALDSAELLAKG